MNENSVSSARRYDFDWLRALLILTVLVFHSLRLFDLEGWTVKSANTYLSVQVLIVFISRWMMPAIMLISGIATFYALGKRSPGRFVKDRSLRLLIPLLIGLFTHIPLQVYLGQIGQNQFNGSFWQWYAGMFTDLGRFADRFNWRGGHLWYLEVLFLFGLACLPLFLWLRHGSGQRLLSWLGDRLSRPGGLYLVVLPILLLSATLDPENGSLLTSEDFGGWNLPSHLLFFLSGFVFASSPAMQATVRRIRRISLVVGLAIFFVAGGLLLALAGDVTFGTPVYMLWTVISSVCCWAGVLAILGYGMQRLNVRTPVLDYANDAVLPFYVLHQSVLFVIAFNVLKWALPVPIQWVLILVSTFAIIMALYEFLIRRVNLLRVLFGMKPGYQEKLVQKPAGQVL